jgi:uncharacterized protein
MPRARDLFVDTSGWGYYIDRKEPLNPDVVALMRLAVIQQRKLITTNYIIHELVALLTSRYHVPRPQVIRAINAIKMDTTVEVVHIDRTIDDEAWRLLETHLDKHWSLVDACSFTIMRHFGMREALASDHHFEQAGFVKLLHTSSSS